MRGVAGLLVVVLMSGRAVCASTTSPADSGAESVSSAVFTLPSAAIERVNGTGLLIRLESFDFKLTSQITATTRDHRRNQGIILIVLGSTLTALGAAVLIETATTDEAGPTGRFPGLMVGTALTVPGVLVIFKGRALLR
jgi:hypothetical protein